MVYYARLDLHKVAVKKGNLVVGHMSRTVTAVCSLFLWTGTNIVTVRDSCQYFNGLPKYSLVVPYVFKNVERRGEKLSQ